MKFDKSHIEKILVIKLRAIGDVLLSTIVVPNLRAAFPNAKIDFLTENPARDVVLGNTELDSVIVFNSKKQNGINLILDVRKRKYDLVFDLFGNPRSALVTQFSGAKYRVGYRFGWRERCYNIVVEPRGGEVHNTEFNLDALRAFDIPIVKKEICFPVSAEHDEFAKQFFSDMQLTNSFVVAMNVAGGWYTKRWGLPKFAQLANQIVEKHNAKIVLLWGPGERDEAERIKALMAHDALLIPPTTLPQLAAILKQCTILVTNDSGPMHIAASVGTPTVSIFGPTNPMLQGPFGNKAEVIRNEQLTCLTCNYTKCPIGNPCMEELQVEDVMNAFERLRAKVG